MNQSTKRSPRFLLLMPEDIREGIERSANEHKRTLTKEINMRLRVSLGASGHTLQTILAREAFGGPDAAAPGIAPSAITPPGTAPNGQPVHLSDHDMEMLRIFHALSVEKQLALLSLFKQP